MDDEKKKRDKEIDKARSFDIRSLPNRIDILQFEELIFSVAVAFVDILEEAADKPSDDNYEEARDIAKNQRWLLDPANMSMELKSKILPHLSDWVEVEYAEGHERMFRDGTYSWDNPVPLGNVLKAFNEAGVCWPRELEEDELDD